MPFGKKLRIFQIWTLWPSRVVCSLRYVPHGGDNSSYGRPNFFKAQIGKLHQ